MILGLYFSGQYLTVKLILGKKEPVQIHGVPHIISYIVTHIKVQNSK